MLIFRKGPSSGASSRTSDSHRERDHPRKLGEGGPVFLPRRKPSALAEQLLAQADQVSAYDDSGLAGRPSS